MQIHVTKKQDLQTNTWSGGTTTQLAIYPKEAAYKNLDFIFRISTATIDVEQSAFTSLPDVSRFIMVLKGELTILHKDHYTKYLKKFDTYSFSGNWETTSLGKVTDFNVMTKGKTKANLAGFSLSAGTSKEFLIDSDLAAVYVSTGELVIEKVVISQGDLALITREDKNENFTLQALHTADIVITQIYL